MDDLLAFADYMGALSDMESGIADHGELVDIGENLSDNHFPPPEMLPCFSNPVLCYQASCRPELFPESSDRISPDSPTAKGRVTLFSGAEKPLELDIGGELNDPRCLYVIDHPGRNSQFKHWFSSGLIHDDKRRTTFREETSKVPCWEPPADQIREITTDGILGLLQPLRQGLSIPGIAASSEQSASSSYAPSSNSNQSDLWRSRCFFVGNNLKVAMTEMGLTDDLFRVWCMSFNDLLCGWGLSDRTTLGNSGTVSLVDADLDFSRNALTEAAIVELVKLLSAFKRLRVRTLRLSNNLLSDSILTDLLNLPYLHQLYIDDNSISSLGVISWIPEMVARKHELYDILIAQDTPDAGVKYPMYLSVSGNIIHGQLGLISELESSGLGYCNADASGCIPSSECRVLGPDCSVHLVGLGCQNVRQSSV